MYFNFIKINWFRIFVSLSLLIVIFLSFYYFLYNPYLKEKKESNCREVLFEKYKNKGENIDSEILKNIEQVCSLGALKDNLEILENNSKEKNMNSCNFEFLDIKVERYHFDGPDQEKIKRLEESCNSDSPWAKYICESLEDEKNSNRKNTYIEIEGLIKSNSDEYLNSIVSKMYTKGENRILLGKSYEDINKNIKKGEAIPFKISVFIDRNQLIGKYFEKDDEVYIDTYPWFTTCK